jgi:phage/plasmid-associated DNA primase
VKGLLLYQEEGIAEPECITKWTQEQYDAQNPIAEWFKDRVIIEEWAWVSFKELYESYECWCREEGEPVDTNKKAFSKAILLNDNITKDRKNGERGFYGIRLGLMG